MVNLDWTFCLVFLCCHLLVFEWGHVSECGMDTRRIVVQFDVFEDVLLCLLSGLIVSTVDELSLQGFEERFRYRVVVRVAWPGDGLGDPMAFQALLERV